MSSSDDITDLDRRIVGLSALIGVEEDNPENYKHFLERSKLFYEKELYKMAYEDALAALRYNPKSLEANLAAGKATLKLKRYDECYAYYKEGLAVDSKNEEIIQDLKDLQEIIIEDFEQRTEGTPENTYNAVELCSQDCYPGDDELFKLEVEILLKKYKIDMRNFIKPVDVLERKRKEAATIGVLAYNARQDGRLQESLEYCQVALQKDPANYRLLQMRAEAFNDLEEHVHALRDLVMIPKPYRFIEAWKLGGKLLAGFNLPVMAEFWLRKATAMIPEAERRKDLEAQTLFQKIRTKRVYGPLTVDFAVKVDFTDFGRTVFATDTIEPGENAFEDKPVVIGILLNCMDLPACAHCASSLITPKHFFGSKYDGLQNELKSFVEDLWPDVKRVSCDGCTRERYCSVTCKDEAWNSYHQLLCPSVNPPASELYDLADRKGYGMSENGVREELWVGHYSPIVLGKMWALIIVEAKRLMKEKGLTEPTKDMWARAKMPLRKFISYGSNSAVQRMPEMFSLMTRIFADCGDGVTYPITEAEFEARYFQATCNLQAFSSALTPKNLFMEKLAKTEDIRALRILKYLEDKGPIVSFAGMFPLHACMNHACDNNVEVMDGFADGKPGVQVRVKRPIAPGDELFTTYIDTSMPRKLRRAWLYKSFNFWCNCKRCQFEGDDNTICTNCKTHAKDKKFPGCSRCKRAWYCSTKCQKQAWVKGHKEICNLVHSEVQSRSVENQ